jgi:hypothetical protein
MTNLSLVSSFRHRENLDGTWDSICMRCYATAAHTHEATLLIPAESGHHCDEASWFFKEPASGVGARQFDHVPFGQQALTLRHSGRPSGLREQVAGRRG